MQEARVTGPRRSSVQMTVRRVGCRGSVRRQCRVRRSQGGVAWRSLRWSTGSGCRKHDHFRSDFHPPIKVHDVLIGQPDTAGRNPLPDRIGVVGAVNSIFRLAQIHRPGAERVAGTACHKPRQIGLTHKHLCGRTPIRPFCLAGHRLLTGPCETFAANADAVAHGLRVVQNEIKECVAGIDDHGARRLVAGVVNHLPNKCSGSRQRLLVFRPEAPGPGSEPELRYARTGVAT